MNDVFVVTYWDINTEPVVTVFDNHETAKECYEKFKDSHLGACLDECPIYSKFSTDEKPTLS